MFLTEPLRQIDNMPPRLPLLMAMSLTPKVYEPAEVVYQNTDQPMHLFLVLQGIFAFVGIPSDFGGLDPFPPAAVTTANTFGHGTRAKTMLGMSDDIFGGHHEPQELYPYQIFGYHNFFGECELLQGLNMRRGFCRCESAKGGTVLALDRDDFFKLKDDFPIFTTFWEQMARRRESHRQRLMRRLKKPGGYKALAMKCIQRVWHRAIKNAERRKNGDRRRSMDSDEDDTMPLQKQESSTDQTRRAHYLAWKSEKEGTNGQSRARVPDSELAELRGQMQSMDARMQQLQASVDLLVKAIQPPVPESTITE